jgi:hypothetical protein
MSKLVGGWPRSRRPKTTPGVPPVPRSWGPGRLCAIGPGQRPLVPEYFWSNAESPMRSSMPIFRDVQKITDSRFAAEAGQTRDKSFLIERSRGFNPPPRSFADYFRDPANLKPEPAPTRRRLREHSPLAGTPSPGCRFSIFSPVSPAPLPPIPAKWHKKQI